MKEAVARTKLCPLLAQARASLPHATEADTLSKFSMCKTTKCMMWKPSPYRANAAQDEGECGFSGK